MRLPGWLKRETRDASYTDAVIEAIVRQAGGTVLAQVTSTAALETAAGVVGRAFASAIPKCESAAVTAALTPEVLSTIGRALIRSGEAAFAIETDGGLRLSPAGMWTVTGGYRPDTWAYQLTMAGPSETTTRTIDAAGVVHVRYAIDPDRPWAGIGPLEVASMAARLSAETENALGDEASGPRGNLLPVPQDGASPTLDDLSERIGKLKGKMALVETTAGAWGNSTQGAPRRDWQAVRFGADPPAALVELYRFSGRAVLAACGLPVELVETSDGTGQREAWRRLLFGTIAPLARQVEAELSAKLETDITLTFDELRASDLAGRARAFQSMVTAGMEVEKAAALSGLTQPE